MIANKKKINIWGLVAAIQRDSAPDCLIVRDKKLIIFNSYFMKL
jgi:hypothetical protein